jgi:hypothetical protein
MLELTLFCVLYFGFCLFAGVIVAHALLALVHRHRVAAVIRLANDQLIEATARKWGQAFADRWERQHPGQDADRRLYAAEMTDFCHDVIRSYIRNF